jgi:hypothetical protein
MGDGEKMGYHAESAGDAEFRRQCYPSKIPEAVRDLLGDAGFTYNWLRRIFHSREIMAVISDEFLAEYGEGTMRLTALRGLLCTLRASAEAARNGNHWRFFFAGNPGSSVLKSLAAELEAKDPIAFGLDRDAPRAIEAQPADQR